jgi:predicted transcriptional regulator
LIINISIIMNTRETLVLKTLQCKALHNGADNARFVDHLLEQNPEQADAITKNVCARIPKLLAERMEEIGSLLDLNKREMITMALIDFLEKAKATLDEFDAWPKGEVVED